MAGLPVRSKRPYLLRALYQWIVDSDLTPYLLVSVDSDAVQVPRDYVSDGRIVLNVSPNAIRDLDLGDSQVFFSGRFAGRSFPVQVPIENVLAIYARENGEGMMFAPESEAAAPPVAADTPAGPPENSSPPKPNLTVIK
ncbi:MAG: ClpXP protease specificity-enhancing factor [Pseudomonadales bacterium]|nr:ClpXP protease specificity-enhancing factor [Pseudomonadales bacterium]